MPIRTLVPINRRWYPPQSATADNTGTATITLPSVGGDWEWEIDTIIVQSNSTQPGPLGVYLDAVNQQGLISQSKNGVLDTFEGSLSIPGGSTLILQWTGVAAGALCTARFHYVEFAPGLDDTILRTRR